jgi:hypothetical protein
VKPLNEGRRFGDRLQIMRIALNTLLLLLFVTFVSAQGKFVMVERLEVDRKPVVADLKVTLFSGGKSYEAKATRKGFFVPPEVTDEWVRVILAFKSYSLDFSSIHNSNFNTTWIVGVDRKPFDRELLGETKASDVHALYYIEFDGEPGRQFVVKVTKPRKLRQTSTQEH